jgi:hypothetical protein
VWHGKYFAEVLLMIGYSYCFKSIRVRTAAAGGYRKRRNAIEREVVQWKKKSRIDFISWMRFNGADGW